MADMTALTLEVDGRVVVVPAQTILASVLVQEGVAAFRRSVGGEPRWPLCGMGTCFECRVTVDGRPHVRACLTPCRDGMSVNTEFGAGDGRERLMPADSPRKSSECGAAGTESHWLDPPPLAMRHLDQDILIVGGGPAGMAAAAAAATGTGLRVAIVDENPALGGQIWRRELARAPRGRALTILAAVEDAGVELHPGACIVAAHSAGELLAADASGALRLTFRRLILATGARERFLPFPGWTLPGVLGAGGIQALVKGGTSVRGKRVVVAGSGPLLLAVAGTLRARGARLVCLAEQAPVWRLARLASELVCRPAKLAEAATLEWRLLGVRRRFGAWPIAAEGDGKLELVTLDHRGKRMRMGCDLLACGFGLVPNATLGRHLGCELEGEALSVDGSQRTSVPDVFAAGEVTGVCGVEAAIVEGRIAGLLAAERHSGELEPLAMVRRRWRRFGTALDSAYALGSRGARLCAEEPATLLCRCEDVPVGAVVGCHDARDAKLRTRCGMGACQGRVCGDAMQRIFGWEPPLPRPPLTPVNFEVLAQLGREQACGEDLR